MREQSQIHTRTGLGHLIIACTLLVSIWGSAFTFVEIAVKDVSPIWVVALRLILGMGLLCAYLKYKGKSLPALSDIRWPFYFVLSIPSMVLPFFLLSHSQTVIDSSLAAILATAMPIFTIFLAHYFTDEKLTWMKFIGFLVSFIGIIILFLPEDLSLNVVGTWKEQLMGLAAAFCYAVSTVGAKRAPPTDALVGSVIMVMGGAILATLAALMTGLPAMPGATSWAMILGLAIGATSVGTILYLYVIDISGPTIVAKINYFIPVITVILGTLFLGEVFSAKMGVAFVIIIVGIIIARQ